MIRLSRHMLRWRARRCLPPRGYAAYDMRLPHADAVLIFDTLFTFFFFHDVLPWMPRRFMLRAPRLAY